MKKINFIAIVAVAMVATACSSDDAPLVKDNVNATFSGTINNVKSRAYNATWEAGDAIGIIGNTGDMAYFNVKYVTAAGDGNFEVGTAGEEVYYQDNNTTTFQAYYPWNSIEDPEVTASTAEQANQKAFDFLWAEATGSKASPKVNFTFGHKMAKVVLTFKRGDGVWLEEIKESVISLDDIKLAGKMALRNGVASATGVAVNGWTIGNNSEAAYNAPVVVDEDAETVTYSLIVYPQAFETGLKVNAEIVSYQTFSAVLDFTAANRNAGDATPANELVAGRQYNVNVRLSKTGLVVEGCTITDWEVTAAGDFEAK